LLEGARAPAAAAGGVTITVAPPSGLLPYGADADLVLVGDAFLEPRALSLRPHESVDGSRRLLAMTTPPNSISHAVTEQAALGVAAQLIGLTDRRLTRNVDYARERHQFGVTIASFPPRKNPPAN